MKKFVIILVLSALCCASYAADITVGYIAYNFSKENENEVYVAGRFPYLTEDEIKSSEALDCPFWEIPLKPEYGFYRGDFSVPESVNYNGKKYTVTGVAYSAFNYPFVEAISLDAVKLPPSIKVIEQAAFANNGRMSSLSLGNPEIIKEGAFDNLNGIKELNLRTVKDLRCHIDIPSLETLHFPDDIDHVSYCNYNTWELQLKEIIFYTSNPRIDSYLETQEKRTAFLRKYVTLVVPDDAIEAYKNHPHWGLYQNIISHSERGIASEKKLELNNDVVSVKGKYMVNNSNYHATIYDTLGRLCGTVAPGESSEELDNGMYIAVVGNRSVKIFVQ